VLRPFEEATKAVSGNKYMTASLVIVLAEGLKMYAAYYKKKITIKE